MLPGTELPEDSFIFGYQCYSASNVFATMHVIKFSFFSFDLVDPLNPEIYWFQFLSLTACNPSVLSCRYLVDSNAQNSIPTSSFSLISYMNVSCSAGYNNLTVPLEQDYLFAPKGSMVYLSSLSGQLAVMANSLRPDYAISGPLAGPITLQNISSPNDKQLYFSIHAVSILYGSTCSNYF